MRALQPDVPERRVAQLDRLGTDQVEYRPPGDAYHLQHLSVRGLLLKRLELLDQ